MTTPDSGRFQQGKHHISYRVYYEDTDAAGIVYYANYLKFAERARTEALRLAGIHQAELMKKEDVGFVVRRCEADFLSAARLDDTIVIETSLQECSGPRITMRQILSCGSKTVADLVVRIVCVNSGLKPMRPPSAVMSALTRHLTLEETE